MQNITFNTNISYQYQNYPFCRIIYSSSFPTSWFCRYVKLIVYLHRRKKIIIFINEKTRRRLNIYEFYYFSYLKILTSYTSSREEIKLKTLMVVDTDYHTITATETPEIKSICLSCLLISNINTVSTSIWFQLKPLTSLKI